MKVMDMRTKSSLQSGFTLVEMAIVILILGLVVGSVFSFLSVRQTEDRQRSTMQKQDRIAKAFGFYVQTNGRLPCPASQNVNEEDLGEARVTCSGSTLRGIVPFRTLGLTRDDIIDGYDHPFSYVVAPAVSQNLTDNNVHLNCRTPIWIPNAVAPATPSNLNPPKARYCCQAIATGGALMVYNNKTMVSSNLVTPVQTGPGNMGNIETQELPNGNTDVLAYFAYVLISHGQNGGGYFILPKGTIKYENPKTMQDEGTAEGHNGMDDTSMNFFSMPKSDSSGNDHFDDIVLWRTQQRTIGELNNDSCARP